MLAPIDSHSSTGRRSRRMTAAPADPLGRLAAHLSALARHLAALGLPAEAAAVRGTALPLVDQARGRLS